MRWGNNMTDIKRILEENPVIAAVKDMKGLEEALETDVEIIFILFGDIMSVKDISRKVSDKDKIGIIHIDLVEGLSNKEVVIKFIKEETSFNGIISTKSNLIKLAKYYGLVAIQRFFVFDTLSLNNSKNHAISDCDAIEILPGVIPKVIKNISASTRKPVVSGGLIDSKDDVIMALNAGATCVSTSKAEIWQM